MLPQCLQIRSGVMHHIILPMVVHSASSSNVAAATSPHLFELDDLWSGDCKSLQQMRAHSLETCIEAPPRLGMSIMMMAQNHKRCIAELGSYPAPDILEDAEFPVHMTRGPKVLHRASASPKCVHGVALVLLVKLTGFDGPGAISNE